MKYIKLHKQKGIYEIVSHMVPLNEKLDSAKISEIQINFTKSNTEAIKTSCEYFNNLV